VELGAEALGAEALGAEALGAEGVVAVLGAEALGVAPKIGAVPKIGIVVRPCIEDFEELPPSDLHHHHLLLLPEYHSEMYMPFLFIFIINVYFHCIYQFVTS